MSRYGILTLGLAKEGFHQFGQFLDSAQGAQVVPGVVIRANSRRQSKLSKRLAIVMNIDWNKDFNSKKQYWLTHIIWMLANINFSIGEISKKIKDEPALESFVLLCIIVSQTISIINYRRNPTLNLFMVVAGLFFWSIGFVLSRAGIINDFSYGFFIAIFVFFVLFNSLAHKAK